MEKKIILQVIDKTGVDPGSKVLIRRGDNFNEYLPTTASKERLNKLFEELGLIEILYSPPLTWFISNSVES